jgi:hypothetical protein
MVRRLQRTCTWIKNLTHLHTNFIAFWHFNCCQAGSMLRRNWWDERLTRLHVIPSYMVSPLKVVNNVHKRPIYSGMSCFSGFHGTWACSYSLTNASTSNVFRLTIAMCNNPLFVHKLTLRWHLDRRTQFDQSRWKPFVAFFLIANDGKNFLEISAGGFKLKLSYYY